MSAIPIVIYGKSSAWAIRWHGCAKPGTYIVTVVCDAFVHNFDAICDDYGNLVRAA